MHRFAADSTTFPPAPSAAVCRLHTQPAFRSQVLVGQRGPGTLSYWSAAMLQTVGNLLHGKMRGGRWRAGSGKGGRDRRKSQCPVSWFGTRPVDAHEGNGTNCRSGAEGCLRLPRREVCHDRNYVLRGQVCDNRLHYGALASALLVVIELPDRVARGASCNRGNVS